jgi:hypothetical protein
VPIRKRPGIDALACLQLRGELTPVWHEALGLGESVDAG